MIPRLSLGGSSVPPIPTLTLTGGAPAVETDGAVPMARSENSANSAQMGRGLGLGLLNLTNLPPAAAKSEKHNVFICAPFAEFETEIEFPNFQKNLESTFGPGTSIFELTKNPPQWIVEGSPDATESTIPSLDVIDAAYQDVEHLPFLIDQVESEGARLGIQLEQEVAEIEGLRNEREQLRIEIAVLNEKVQAVRAESVRFAEAAARVKGDFDCFIEKIGGGALH
jgi:hypothetical protein